MNTHGQHGAHAARGEQDREMNMGVNDIPGPADGMAASSMTSGDGPGRSTLSKPLIMGIGILLVVLALLAGYSL